MLLRVQKVRMEMKKLAWVAVVATYFLMVWGNIVGSNGSGLGFSPTVSTALLVIATLVFSGLIALACGMTWKNPVVSPTSPKIKRLAVAGLFALLIQFILGSLVRHNHSGLACPNFPTCLDGFFPIPFTFDTALSFTHRWWGILMVGVFAHLTFAAPKLSPKLAGAARQLLPLSLVQIILGIGTVMSGMNTHSRATHAGVGYLLWGVLFYIAIRAGAFRWLWSSQS
jgi:heme A synthase